MKSKLIKLPETAKFLAFPDNIRILLYKISSTAPFSEDPAFAI